MNVFAPVHFTTAFVAAGCRDIDVTAVEIRKLVQTAHLPDQRQISAVK
jgi:hypothetical protein